MENTEYLVRDLRVYHAWQSQNALRVLFEGYKGVESRNLITLYVALTLKSTYNRFQDTFLTTNKEIGEYTGLNHDWVPKGLRILRGEGLIKAEVLRDSRGFVLGKTVSLLDAPSMAAPQHQKSGASFLVGLEYKKEREIKYNLKEEKKDISNDIIETESRSGIKTNPAISAEVWDDFSDILDYGIKIGVLRQPRITEDGDFYRVPKYMKQAIEKMMRLKQNQFINYYKVDGSKHNPANWREDIFKALDNFKIVKEDGRVWPTNKATLPKDLNAFLYNDRTSFSWFIKCLDEISTQKEERIEAQYGALVEDSHEKIFLKWFKANFYELDYDKQIDFKRNLGELITEHAKLWEDYGQYYTKLGMWLQYLGGKEPTKFLAFYLQFLSDRNFTPHESKLRPNSSAFISFLAYLHKEYEMDLQMSDKEKQELIARGKPVVRKSTTNKKLNGLPGVADGVLSTEDIIRG